MKAIVYENYGPLDVLKIKDVQKPLPGDDKVLIKVKNSSVNFNIKIFVSGKPVVGRLWTGLFKPKGTIPGNDVAGIAESVGKNVTAFKPGDEVFGNISGEGFSAFAEYACVSEKALLHKPSNLSFEEAAAVSEAGLVAFQALRDKGNLKEGMKVLVYGASGGIGTFAVQIAKAYGAEVTGVCSGKNADLVKSLGADHVIDYKTEDFTQNGQTYDLILSTAGFRSISDYKRSLSSDGTYVSTGGDMKQIFQALLLGPFMSLFSSKKLCGMEVTTNKDLDLLKELIESGKVKPVIDKIYPMEKTVEALKYYGTGRTKGKIIIGMQN